MKKKKLIGGEFYASKFKSKNKNFPKIFNNGTFFQSGRSGLNFLINNLKQMNKIYLPAYSCHSINDIIKDKKKIIYYDIDKNFHPILKKKIKNSLIIISDYFGKKISVKNFDDNLIIHDISHSWFNYKKIKKIKNYYYFSSLRKFGFYNLGGWCSLKFKKKLKISENKLSNKLYKLRNEKYNLINNKLLYDNLINQNYLVKKFNNLEREIIKDKKIIQKKNIANITNLNLTRIGKIRKKNYYYLKKKINSKYIIDLNLKKNETPLFFLLIFLNEKERNKIRNFLIRNNIFCPIHWKIKYDKFNNSNKLSKKTLSIPIDHRYNTSDMSFIINTFKRYKKSFLKTV